MQITRLDLFLMVIRRGNRVTQCWALW